MIFMFKIFKKTYQIDHFKFNISLAGKLVYLLYPKRKNRILENINIVFPNQFSKQDKKRFIQGFYTHMISSIKETLILHFFPSFANKNLKIIGKEHLIHGFKQNHGIILLTAHLGNIQYVPIIAARELNQLGKFGVFVNNQKNKRFQDLFHNGYKHQDIQPIPSAKGLIKTIKLLKANTAIYFALDQFSINDNNMGLTVPFFNKMTLSYPTAAFLSERTGAAVIPCRTYRTLDKSHVLEFFPALTWREADCAQEEIRINTEYYNQVLEQLILGAPTQWCWAYHRWRT
jgi:KDO2-lipid IV(A) lauroyltransferase